jgi:hypothetical protein
MPILQAQIPTDRGSRYLIQFCKHAAAMGQRGGHSPRMHLHAPMARSEVQVAAEWSDTSGTVTFTPWGRCTLAADNGTLTLRIDAADEDAAARIRDIITRDFERFTRRDPVTVTWHRSDTPGAAPFRPTSGVEPEPRRGFPRPSRRTILLAVAVVLAIGLHVGLAGAIVARSRWTDIGVNVVAALVALKIALIVWTRVRIRRRRATTTATAPDAPEQR